MLFVEKLRARIKSGAVTASVRVWQTPRVRVGGKYRLEQGHIEARAPPVEFPKANFRVKL